MESIETRAKTQKMIYSIITPVLPALSGTSLVLSGQCQALVSGAYPKISDVVFSNSDYSIAFFFCFEDLKFKMLDQNGNWLLWLIDPKYQWNDIYNWKLTYDGDVTLRFYLDDTEQLYDSMSENPLIFLGFSDKVNVGIADGIITFIDYPQ